MSQRHAREFLKAAQINTPSDTDGLFVWQVDYGVDEIIIGWISEFSQLQFKLRLNHV